MASGPFTNEFAAQYLKNQYGYPHFLFAYENAMVIVIQHVKFKGKKNHSKHCLPANDLK